MKASLFDLARLVLTYLPVIVTLAGMGLIAYGASLIYLPAGFIVAGVGLILAAIDGRL